MLTATIICLVLFIICSSLVVFDVVQKDWLVITLLIVGITTGIASVTLACIKGFNKAKNTPIEYSSDKYSLEYKITEYKGQIDTTYVLVPKDN